MFSNAFPRRAGAARCASLAALHMGLALAACSAPATPEHAAAGHSTSAAPFDAQFIDSMIEHHEGAIVMANEAQNQAQRPEIKALASAVLAAQQGEIKQMRDWRAQWFPDLKDKVSMNMDMEPMTVPSGADPHDIRFNDAMIPHHESAISKAQEALKTSQRAEIKALATAIVAAQTAQIEQMKAWRAAWK